LTPAHELPGFDFRPPLDRVEKRFVNDIKCGKPISGRGDFAYARALVGKGWLSEPENEKFVLSPDPDPAPQWIWLPNELVTGANAEIPPVELLRQGQEVMLLRLLVDFYSAQNLRDDGGIGKQVTHQKYHRVKVGEQGQYTVWGFRLDCETVIWEGPTACHRRTLTEEERASGARSGDLYFRRMAQLVKLGLVEWIPHLYESDGDEAEVVHPFGIGRSNNIEDRIGTAAHLAGLRLLTQGQREWAAREGLWLVPVLAHIADAKLYAIARLRYRPHTSMTAAWWAELSTKGERLIDVFERLGNRTPE